MIRGGPKIRSSLIGCVLVVFLLVPASSAREPVVVGSKKFTESYILAEVIAQLLEADGIQVERRFGLGGTMVCYEALRNGEIDVYPEYSGTIEQAILKSQHAMTLTELSAELRTEHGLVLLDSLGFNNTYALAMNRAKATKLKANSISDLSGVAGLRYAFSHEFLNRQDGWPGLSVLYQLDAEPLGIEHGLAYQAIDERKIDITDVYSTDGDIEKYDLVLLADDLGYFPRYLAAPLTHDDGSEDLIERLNRLGGRISDEKMRAMNADVLLRGQTFAAVASGFLDEQGLADSRRSIGGQGFWSALFRRTATHLKLTLIALAAGMIVAIPLGIVAFRVKAIGRPVTYLAGVLQTIPSIALLALMIPFFGIGAMPAIVALFLYALLPILRNTTTALLSIDPVLRRVARGMGMTGGQRLRYVELPLAAPTILAGVKTAAVINVGTATLAAFIGAGGLGEPIVTGLALNDTSLVLEGAIPAATLAVLTELAFEAIERVLVPRHLVS